MKARRVLNGRRPGVEVVDSRGRPARRRERSRGSVRASSARYVVMGSSIRWPDLDRGRVEALLPGRRHGDDDVAADELRPVQVVADRRAEQASPEAACCHSPYARLKTATPDHGSAAGSHGEAVAIEDVAQPVLEAAHHDRDDRTHPRRVLAIGLAPLDPALHGLGRGKRLRHAERDRGVDADAAVGRLLHRRQAGRRWSGT